MSELSVTLRRLALGMIIRNPGVSYAEIRRGLQGWMNSEGKYGDSRDARELTVACVISSLSYDGFLYIGPNGDDLYPSPDDDYGLPSRHRLRATAGLPLPEQLEAVDQAEELARARRSARCRESE